MAVNPIIERYSWDVVSAYCHGLESCVICIVPPYCFQFLPGRSNTSLSHLLLNMHTGDHIPTCLISNIYIGLYLPKAPTLTGLQWCKMFPSRLIISNRKCVDLWRILNVPLLSDAFQFCLGRGIPLMEGAWNIYNLMSELHPPYRR